jgi:PleD family two-component response regulator
MRIYFADDEADERDIMAATLSSGGYNNAHFATSGLDLLAKLGVDPVGATGPQADLILLDIRMPGIDGVETCARIRGDSRYQHTPILMVSSLDDLETLNHAFLAGATDYIGKPCNRTELLARLRSSLRLKGELDRRFAREQELLAAQEVRGLRRRDATSTLDPATSLLPRETLDSYVSAVRPPVSAGLGAFALQIDRLAMFEQNYGGEAKLDLLRSISETLRSIPAHLGDMLAHYEIGLFIAVLHNTNPAAIGEIAQLARQSVRDLAVPHLGAGASDIVTVSIGVAHNREPRALLSAAVSTVERAAGEGGDRILFDQP